MSEQATKRCSRCEETKSIDEFHCQRKAWDGKQCYCKQCQTNLAREWQRANRSYVNYLKRNGIRHRDTPLRCSDCL